MSVCIIDLSYHKHNKTKEILSKNLSLRVQRHVLPLVVISLCVKRQRKQALKSYVVPVRLRTIPDLGKQTWRRKDLVWTLSVTLFGYLKVI